MKKSFVYFALLFSLAISVLTFQFCKEKEVQEGKIVIKVNDKTLIAEDKDLPELTETRGAVDVAVASAYLLNVAIAANITAQLAEAVKGKKKTLPAIWAMIPILIDGLPSLITAANSLKNFQSFYVAAGGLSVDERATVAKYFEVNLALPYPTAESISEATIEAALANMKLAGVIKDGIKK